MSETAAGTGRLFRSLRAEGAAADGAVPALTLDQAVGLRTVTLGAGGDSAVATSVSTEPAAAGAAASVMASEATPLVAPAAAAPALSDDVHLEYAEVAPRPEIDYAREQGSDDEQAASIAAVTSSPASGRGAHAAPGVRATGVWLIVIGVTVVMGFADALVVGQTQLGWLTGVSLLAASVYGALVVRREDAIIAVIAPPLAFFLATITAGQLTLPPTGDLLVREAFMIVTTLGANAPWIFGSTIVALVIVLVRRRRSAPATPSPQP